MDVSYCQCGVAVPEGLVSFLARDDARLVHDCRAGQWFPIDLVAVGTRDDLTPVERDVLSFLIDIGNAN